jgi:hypothetical protein
VCVCVREREREREKRVTIDDRLNEWTCVNECTMNDRRKLSDTEENGRIKG